MFSQKAVLNFFQAALIIVAVSWCTLAQSGQTGVITGKVIDETTLNPLPNTKVVVQGTSISGVTDRTGAFRIERVPVGTQTLEFSYLGYDLLSREVIVPEGDSLALEISLKQSVQEVITVYGEPILQGQSRALNQQKNAETIQNVVSADQIGRFPDPNAAEATQRIPGITIQRDQGEGRYVLVRGTEARLNAMMINGQRVPSPEGDIRQVALDVIPADLLETIEVTKALTPDMDADSIGGSVNLVTKQAPERRIFSITYGAGLNNLVQGAIQNGNVTFGQRFFDNKLGVVASGSFFNTNRGSQNFETSYDDGEIEDFELRDYSINRKRHATNLALDLKPNASHTFFFNGIYNYYSDQEYRRRVTNKVQDNEIERELKDRFEVQRIAQFSIGGKHFLPQNWQVDYRFSYGYAEEDEPNALNTAFLQEDVEFRPNVTPTSIDPDNIRVNALNEDVSKFKLDELSNDFNFTSDRDISFWGNIAHAFLVSDGISGSFKAGGKFWRKRKFRNNETTIFKPEDDVFLKDNLDRQFFAQKSIIDGRYVIGQHVNAAAARAFLTSLSLERETDFEADAADFLATERIGAGYAMATFYFGQRFSLLPGFRYEHTSYDYKGFDVLFNPDGDYVSTTPVTGKSSTGIFLPALHAKYRLGENTNVRAAFTRSLARPNYVDLVPTQLIIEEDEEITRGNPNLDLTRSWNVDVLAEHYFNTVGVVSGGFFYKKIDDFIFPFQFREQRNGDSFDVTQPQNGKSADLYGLEFAFQNKLRFLPGPLDGFGLYFNYTYTNSNAKLQDGRVISLPGQNKHTGNASINYEKKGFSGSLSWNYQGKYLNEVGAEPNRDIFLDDRLQLDLSVSQAITPKIRVFGQLINLTNSPFRRFEGINVRPVQEEYYSFWGTFGVKIDF